jgi:hypothetical protein
MLDNDELAILAEGVREENFSFLNDADRMAGA